MIADYPRLLCREIELRREGGGRLAPRSVYTGGGTPSLLGPHGFSDLAERLKTAVDPGEIEEWSVEMNPTSATPELLRSMRVAGVDRLTFGVQSFNDALLQRVNRAGGGRETGALFRAARACGFDNLGIDLIAGLPGVTAALWAVDLECALALEPEHISLYALSIEPGTPLAGRAEREDIPDGELQLDLLCQAAERMHAAGYRRYEISNYARPGRECRHNLALWRGEEYLGAGPAAVSRIGTLRRENRADLAAWSAALTQGRLPPADSERLTELDDALQRALFRLRLDEGVDPAACAQVCTVLAPLLREWEQRFEHLRRQGLVQKNGTAWSLTPRGTEVCDSVIREFI